MPGERTLFDAISDRRTHWSRGPVQSHLGGYGFSGDSVLRRCGTLSGGERARMALALMELEGANLLAFDEPTNHLDVESIEAALADPDLYLTGDGVRRASALGGELEAAQRAFEAAFAAWAALSGQGDAPG